MVVMLLSVRIFLLIVHTKDEENHKSAKGAANHTMKSKKTSTTDSWGGDGDSKSVFNKNSETNRRHSIAISPEKEDVSSPAKVAKTKSKVPSTPAKKQLSFPASGTRRHSVPSRIGMSSNKNGVAATTIPEGKVKVRNGGTSIHAGCNSQSTPASGKWQCKVLALKRNTLVFTYRNRSGMLSLANHVYVHAMPTQEQHIGLIDSGGARQDKHEASSNSTNCNSPKEASIDNQQPTQEQQIRLIDGGGAPQGEPGFVGRLVHPEKNSWMKRGILWLILGTRKKVPVIKRNQSIGNVKTVTSGKAKTGDILDSGSNATDKNLSGTSSFQAAMVQLF
ncbi:hypothetical protein KIW84_022924 [Lathyrus oleraceus]|uniref:Uncharacterized protein n=1 Tax=Pisum sativum TaxID=3888 RepID=A0A9D4YBM5_PEA|nr:hypothetical protein KIW84_022924 [Pisum sativum]